VGRALCRADGPGLGVKSRRPRGRVVKATTTPITKPNPNPSPQLVTEVPELSKVTATRKMGRPEKPEPKPTPPLRRLLGSPRRKQVRVSKPRPANAQTQPGGPHPKFHLRNRGNSRFPRTPSPSKMCGADSPAPRVHLLPPRRGSPPAGCPEDPLFCLWPNMAECPRRTERCKALSQTCWMWTAQRVEK